MEKWHLTGLISRRSAGSIPASSYHCQDHYGRTGMLTKPIRVQALNSETQDHSVAALPRPPSM